MTSPPLAFQWISDPGGLSPERSSDLSGCWSRVSNSGGAVGFPFLPVDDSEVRDATQALRASLSAHRRLLLGLHGGELAGWLVLQLNTSPLIAHWGVVSRVQIDLPFRGLDYGKALMQEAVTMAKSLDLEQLHIAVRGGQGIENFYRKLGWQIVGRWPAALRLGTGEDRDEILMNLRLVAR